MGVNNPNHSVPVQNDMTAGPSCAQALCPGSNPVTVQKHSKEGVTTVGIVTENWSTIALVVI